MTVSSELVLVRPLPETAMGMLFNTVYNCLLGALPKKNNITLGDTSIPLVQSSGSPRTNDRTRLPAHDRQKKNDAMVF